MDLISINPADGTPLWEGQHATASDVNNAITTARAALPEWSRRTVDERASIIRTFGEKLAEGQDHLAKVIAQEVGKPLWEAKTEVSAMISKIEISIDAQKKRCEERHAPPSHTRFKPHGVAAIFGPFNFPGHLPNGHLIPALLAGNTAVIKPSELTPWTMEMVLSYWKEAGIPEGVITLTQGGSGTGIALANHPGIDALFFTGSTRTGTLLAEQFGKHPEKILALELGGNNPLIAWEFDDIPSIVSMIIHSAFITSGQRCTCARRLILPDTTEAKACVDALVQTAQQLKIGAWNTSPFMGPVISKESADHLLSKSNTLSGKWLLPMKREGHAYLTPGVIDVTNTTPPDEELFGPLLQITYVNSSSADAFDRALTHANNTRYGLSAGLISSDPALYDTFFHTIRAGIINWNTPLTGASSAAPFGGLGISGNHRPSAYLAAAYCNTPVASMECPTPKPPQGSTPGYPKPEK